jgi:hypothetical protein
LVRIPANRSGSFSSLESGTAPGLPGRTAVGTGKIDGAVVRQFFVDYWITTHKEMKALGRKYDHSSFVGLY